MKNKMSREKRAKQFMPFAALKGYEEALRAMEKIVVDRKDLSEDRKEELDEVFRNLRPGDMVSVIYYENEEYLKMEGMVSKIVPDSGYIMVVNKKIPLVDIFSLEKNVFQIR